MYRLQKAWRNPVSIKKEEKRVYICYEYMLSTFVNLVLKCCCGFTLILLENSQVESQRPLGTRSCFTNSCLISPQKFLVYILVRIPSLKHLLSLGNLTIPYYTVGHPVTSSKTAISSMVSPLEHRKILVPQPLCSKTSFVTPIDGFSACFQSTY